MKKYLAEMVGTAVLVLLGCGAAVFNVGGVHDVAWVLTVAFAFGFTVVAMAYTIGGISGCHINPAITLGAWMTKRISGKDAWYYVLFQTIGALIGAGILYVLIYVLNGISFSASLGANSFVSGFAAEAFVMEMILTAIFVLVVLGTTDTQKGAGNLAGLVIGLSLVIIHIVAISTTGTSVNPARSIGPAVFEWIAGSSTALSQLWLFILAPLAGGAIAAGLWKMIKPKN